MTNPTPPFDAGRAHLSATDDFPPYNVEPSDERPLRDVLESGEIRPETELDSRPVLIVLDRSTGVPAAYFVEVTSVHAHGDHLHLDNGLTYSDGIFRNPSGDSVKPDRPMQLFSRWYGFSFTFPGCEIYEP
jgi:hypothetical protein